MGLVDDLERLGTLYSAGALNDEEFALLKGRLLGAAEVTPPEQEVGATAIIQALPAPTDWARREGSSGLVPSGNREGLAGVFWMTVLVAACWAGWCLARL